MHKRLFASLLLAATVGVADPEHVYFIGAHPDDMTGCTALALKLSENPKFKVHVIDYTRGGGGSGTGGAKEIERVRSVEEENACAMLGVKPVFLDEPDGFTTAGRETVAKLAEIFKKSPPRAVFTHWPVDTHPDHTATYAAVILALRDAGWPIHLGKPELYFFNFGHQTRSMPIHYYFPFNQKLMDRKAEFCRRYVTQYSEAMIQRKIREGLYHGSQVGGAVSGCSYAEPYGSMYPHVPGLKTIFEEL